MSKETTQDLNNNTLIGYTEKRGNAWHYRASAQGQESNHYAGAIPREDVLRRLFDWQAVSAPLSYTLPDGRTIVDPSRKVIARDDSGAALGIFKNSYQIHQYDEWLIRNLEMLTDADLAIGSAGLLKGGAVAWVQVEMEETMSVAGVEFRPFLTAATSHDGSLASTYQSGAQVVVCDNTLSAALGEKVNRVKVRHSRHSLGKVQEVRDALGIVHQVADDFAAQVEALTAQDVSDRQWKRFVEEYAGLDAAMKKGQGHSLTLAENKVNTLSAMWNTDERVAPWAGTAYGVVAAVNTYTHHEAIVRGAGRAERNMERTVKGEWDALDAGTLSLLDKVMA